MPIPRPFCPPRAARLFFESPLLLAPWDGFPVSPGHALLIRRRHDATWFDASKEERRALTSAIGVVRAEIEKCRRPDGYTGDSPEPRGGIRWVVPKHADWTGR